MDYFLLKQDERYTDVPLLMDVHKQIDIRDMRISRAYKIADPLIFHVKAGAGSSFLDIMDRQLLLLSDKLKRVVEVYEPDTLFKLTPLIDLSRQLQKNYYLPILEEMEVLSPRTEFHHGKSRIKKLVLHKEKLRGKKIVRIKESEKPLIVVRLDVAESILRRDLTGIWLARVPVE
ncbi:hypothetical protein [Brevibacillus parabrevis]|uniref:hypothetical protein n=1 Tax=Brevibacillus parabrevis TaxID=54914 RepID=UPI002E1DD204|nr:hypothetical protein [Brevibacillus parabrevis]